ncbi:MAG: DUF111 family protein, partial [Clostridiales bacterium]|nr:DUF111 family protein [Clostridiales bacterium]
MKIAYFDCPAGISGDMSLAALIDAGAEIDKIKNLLSLLPISGWRLGAQEVQKQGLRALKVSVAFTREHAHRGLNEIRKILTVACLPAKVEENALAVFGRLAEAEARVHGCGAEEVHFHETGAVDAIIDIVGVCAALHLLGVEKVFCAPPPLGRGFVQCAHGLLPLPAPAVVELLRGYPSVGLDIEGETVTPTGAALVTALSEPQ